jgi:DNA-binding beta-propeller fold protein YncE
LESTEGTIESTISAYTKGAPLNGPKEIVYVSGVSAFFVANCGGNNIVRVDSSTKAMRVVAGDGAARELTGYNTGAEFNCPFGITTDGTNLYVTDLGGNTVRKISALQ